MLSDESGLQNIINQYLEVDQMAVIRIVDLIAIFRSHPEYHINRKMAKQIWPLDE